MEKTDPTIKEMNEAIVKFMGYVHYCEVLKDCDSECGGLYSTIGIYSKDPIKLNVYEEGTYLDDDFIKEMTDEQRIQRWRYEAENWIAIEIRGYSDLPNELQYHKSFDALMPVIDKIERTVLKDGSFPRVTIDTKFVRIWTGDFSESVTKAYWIKPNFIEHHIFDDEPKTGKVHQAVYDFVKQQ